MYHCKTSVTAVDFSNANPNLLAVGQYDGSVYIYNVRNNVDQPAVDSLYVDALLVNLQQNIHKTSAVESRQH